MPARTFALITILLAALDTGMSFAHALEMPAKLKYDASLYLLLHRTLYWGFGTIGGVIDAAVIPMTALLAYFVRGLRPVFRPALFSALCYAAAMLAFLTLVNPMNMEMRVMNLDAPPAHWGQARNQWEYAHFGRFILQLAGLAGLLTALGRAIPGERRHAARPLESRESERTSVA